MNFILHVLTRKPETPWVVHFDGKDYEMTEVVLDVPCHTRRDGHTPCANWYIEGDAKSIRWVGERLVID